MSTAAPPALGGRNGNPVTAIGVDIGSTNTKVVLLEIADRSGVPRERGIRSFRTPDLPGELGGAVLAAIRGLTSSQHGHPVAVGIASMAEGGIVLDRDGRPVGPIVRWTSADSSPGLFDELGSAEREELCLATGVPATPKVPLATWHRLQFSEPDRWRKLARWAGMADFIGLVLTRELATDHTLAGRTMGYRLPAAGTPVGEGFDDDLLGVAGMSAERMPRILAPGEPVGTLVPGAAEAAGLAPDTPVFLAGHDHAVAAWAAGVRKHGQAADSLGTTEALLRVVGSPIDRSAALADGMSVTRTVAGDLECLLAGASGGTVIARWIAAHPEKDADVLFRALELEGPGDAFVLPYPRGRQSPQPDPAPRELLVGRTETTAEHLRAVLLGLTLHLRWMDETQNRILGFAPTGLRIVGGAAAHNAAWNRLKSRLLQPPLAVVEAREPVASGAALLAAVRIGAALPDAALPSLPFASHPHPRADELLTAFIEAATSTSPSPSRADSDDPAHA
ncbi:FGGY-family carbohydrate kinase [Mycetocola sp.]|uniref:FGGY-family carbohydrate kinase n=1 Tax=Mycetocola sp. TaxID=1871042 RepID=UPI003989CEB1